ncbi:MAG: hypothetical protein KKC53_07005 [Actinobacteria bacterium]|nr:hypothetical protein [Actinomycetota bacterium]
MDKTRFLNDIVFGWIKKDFERMLQRIKVIPSGQGNINFPLALCVLVDMEYLGSFLLGGDCGFNNCAGKYVQKCFKKPNEYPIEILGDIFRHGLAHEYFARGGICREGIRPAVFNDEKIGVILDAETLVKDFLDSLEKFKDELSEEKYKIRMAQAKETIREKLDKHQELINNLPKKPTPTNSISASTTIVTGESIPFKQISTPPSHEEDED